MIVDLVNFGNWLTEHNLDGFGEGNTRDNDYIIEIVCKDDNFILGDIFNIKKYNKHFFRDSIFNNRLYFENSQNIMIPSNSNLPGLSPFFLRVGDLKKFENKVTKSFESNKNEKEFVNALKEIYMNANFLDECDFSNVDELSILKSFFENNDYNLLNDKIISYYNFLNENKGEILNNINNFMDSEDYIAKPKPNFYMLCVFENEVDLLNDIFYYYSKFIKQRNKGISDYEYGICSVCGSQNITFPSIECFGGSEYTSFNYTSNVKNSKLQLCKKCNAKVVFANNKLKNVLSIPNIMIIPKYRDNGDYTNFIKIANMNINSFEKLNKFLKETSHEYDYDLLIYNKENAIMSIKHYITNYRSFLVKFNNLRLYENNTLNFLFNEKFIIEDEDKKKYINNINNFFDLETIFKKFFWDINNGDFSFPKLNHFYEIFTKDGIAIGNNKIFSGSNSSIVSVFTTYMNNIFNFIYELDVNAINKDMINKIALTSIMRFQKNSISKSYKKYIIERLNYYFMFKKEFLSDFMLSDEKIMELKEIFGSYEKSEDFKKEYEKLDKIIEEDPACKYYLLGQFMKLIDSYKFNNGKKPIVFNNFVTNANLNNIRELFSIEVLQKNNFYIEKMNIKAKYVFRMLENNFDSLFNEEYGFKFEDYILLIFTGNYTENILSSKYVNQGVE